MNKIIVISDIHSNYAALESAYHTVEGINPDCIIFLGDYVTDFPYTQRTMNLIYKFKSAYDCRFIRGNREDSILSHRKNRNDGWCYGSSVGSFLYTYENLMAADLDFFAGLPHCLEIKLDDLPIITACHGTPNSTTENILSDSAAQIKYADKLKGNILLCGHTHHKKIVCVNGKKIIFCPSLGVPQDGEEYGHTAITLLTCTGNNAEVNTLILKYDADSLIDDYRKSDLIKYAPIFSECMIKNIQLNNDITYQCVVLAWKYAERDNFHGGNILPEKYWEKAAKELKIV